MSLAISEIDEQPHAEAQPAEPGISLRALVLGVLTIVGMTFYITHFGWNLIKNYMPVSALISVRRVDWAQCDPPTRVATGSIVEN